MVGERTVIGRAGGIDNDVRLGARVKVQSQVYVTAFSVVEDDVFLGPAPRRPTTTRWAATRPTSRCAARPSAAPPASAAARCSCPASRSARRRSWAPAPWSRRTCRRAPSWSGCLRVRCARSRDDELLERWRRAARDPRRPSARSAPRSSSSAPSPSSRLAFEASPTSRSDLGRALERVVDHDVALPVQADALERHLDALAARCASPPWRSRSRRRGPACSISHIAST